MNYDVWFVKNCADVPTNIYPSNLLTKYFDLKVTNKMWTITPQKLETVNDAYELVHIINRHT